MAKAPPPTNQFDVLAVGDHPSAYVAAAAVKAKHPKFAVGHVVLPGESHANRLTLANPKLFDLHPLLGKLKKPFADCGASGALFLSETPNVRGEYTAKAITAVVMSSAAFATATAKAANAAGVMSRSAKQHFEIRRIVDDGVEIDIDGATVTTRMLIVATPLPTASAKVIGLASGFDGDVVQHYRFASFKAAKGQFPPGKPIVMSLDLAQCGAWAWLLTLGETAQISVMQPARRPPLDAGRDLAAWLQNLADHGVLGDAKKLRLGEAVKVDLPVAAALSGETVANRTLLVGPAGGFISACSEDLYPGCWSAIIAADVAAKALSHRHVQDSLLDYRHEWGSTVGDYLRGPQQNLKLLLPLIYRNAIMASRVGEAIFLGESVVR